MKRITFVARGWLNYYGIASMKNNIDGLNGWRGRPLTAAGDTGGQCKQLE